MCAWHARKIHKSVLWIFMVRSTLGTSPVDPSRIRLNPFLFFFFSAITQASAEYIFFPPAAKKQRADGGPRFKRLEDVDRNTNCVKRN